MGKEIGEQHHLRDCNSCQYHDVDPFDKPYNSCRIMYRNYVEEKG
jgi:hypothetical protein